MYNVIKNAQYLDEMMVYAIQIQVLMSPSLPFPAKLTPTVIYPNFHNNQVLTLLLQAG